jgi:hypothetical protein
MQLTGSDIQQAALAEDGKIIVAKEYPNSHRFRVDTDCITGRMQYVGVVWPTPPYSVEAKRTVRKDWWAQRAGEPGSEFGPFPSRQAAVRALMP